MYNLRPNSNSDAGRRDANDYSYGSSASCSAAHGYSY